MEKPALEIRVDAIGGAGINRVARQMVNLARATQFVVICEFQPGLLLRALPTDSHYDVAKQLPGYETDGDALRDYAQPTPREKSKAKTINELCEHLSTIDGAVGDIRKLFQDWGGH
jgi:hypothetical protein